jgi:hypothetical protein
MRYLVSVDRRDITPPDDFPTEAATLSWVARHAGSATWALATIDDENGVLQIVASGNLPPFAARP